MTKVSVTVIRVTVGEGWERECLNGFLGGIWTWGVGQAQRWSCTTALHLDLYNKAVSSWKCGMKYPRSIAKMWEVSSTCPSYKK